jgi:histidine triad (HIT) family protein
MSTIFSKIRDKEIPAEFLYEDEEIFAIKDIMPQANIHILIIPKKDIPTLNDVTKSDTQLLGKMMLVASQLAQRFGIQDSGYRLVMNCNGDGGQTVFQLHLHLLGGEPLRGSFGN